MSPSNSQQDWGFSAMETKTIPLRIWFLLYCTHIMGKADSTCQSGSRQALNTVGPVYRGHCMPYCLNWPASPGPNDTAVCLCRANQWSKATWSEGPQMARLHRFHRDIYSVHEACHQTSHELTTSMPATLPFPYLPPSFPSSFLSQKLSCQYKVV